MKAQSISIQHPDCASTDKLEISAIEIVKKIGATQEWIVLEKQEVKAECVERGR